MVIKFHLSLCNKNKIYMKDIANTFITVWETDRKEFISGFVCILGIIVTLFIALNIFC